MTSGRTIQTAPSGAEAIDEAIADEPPKPPGVRRVDWSRTLAAAKQEQQTKVAAGTTMAHERGQEAQQDQLRHARTPRNVQAGLSVVQPIDELHAAKMPRLGERAPPEKRLSIDDGAMASKADVSSAAKPNKAKMQAAPRMPQTAAISATQASIALTAVTAMATGSEGAETGVEESAAAAVVAMQLPMNDDTAAARPVSSRPHGATPRSEQGRKHNSMRQAARRKERAQEQTGEPDTVPPETEAYSVIAGP